MASLRGVVPALAGTVDGAGPLPGAERIRTRDGDWTLRVARTDGTATTLHSKYDPKREAARLVGEVDPRGLQGFLVLGFGLGYHLQHLLAGSSEGAEVVVLEKDPAVIRAAEGEWRPEAVDSEGRPGDRWAVGGWLGMDRVVGEALRPFCQRHRVDPREVI